MAFHQFFGSSAVVFSDRIQYGMMGMTFTQRVAAFPVKPDNQRRPGHQLGDKTANGVLIGDLSDFDMKLARQAQRAARVFCAQGRMFLFEMVVSPGDIGGGGTCGGRSGGARFQQGSALRHFAGLAQVWLGDKGTPIAFQGDQLIMRQALQGFAYDGAAATINFANLIFGQLRGGA